MQDGENLEKLYTNENDRIEVITLDPTQFLHDTSALRPRKERDVALIMLNSPLASFEHFRNLYHHADFVACADAGANRLYNLVTSRFSDLAYDTAIAKFLPDLIHGDLDSISDEVKAAYQNLNVKITRDGDEYSTDFGKVIKLVLNAKPNTRDILVLGSLGGRVDQGIGLLHELYREQCIRHTHLRFWLFSEASISVILVKGTTRLVTKLEAGLIGRNIGILPIYGPATIDTSGLEWDVRGWHTEIGGMVSTSNHINNDIIEITTTHPVLFTVELVK